jgi:hypothetical protein
LLTEIWFCLKSTSNSAVTAILLTNTSKLRNAFPVMKLDKSLCSYHNSKTPQGGIFKCYVLWNPLGRTMQPMEPFSGRLQMYEVNHTDFKETNCFGNALGHSRMQWSGWLNQWKFILTVLDSRCLRSDSWLAGSQLLAISSHNLCLRGVCVCVCVERFLSPLLSLMRTMISRRCHSHDLITF